jgi:hypothetical protein
LDHARNGQGPVAGNVEVSHQPAQRPHRLGEVREVLHEQDERREERVQRHASQQQHVGREPAVPHLRQGVDDQHGPERTGQAGKGHRRDHAPRPGGHEREGEHRAQRRSRRHPQRERRGQWVAKQGLHHDACHGERGADDAGGQHAGQAGDEEDLCVEVVGKRA